MLMKVSTRLFERCFARMRPVVGIFTANNKNAGQFYRYFSSQRWRIMFFGTDNFALRSLEMLYQELQSGNHIACLSVVTPPPKPTFCPVAKFAMRVQLPLQHWPLAKDEPNAQDWDLGVVASFGHLIPEKIIQSFPLGMLNVHASLLPRWRGAAPVLHAIMNGDQETGITIMRIRPFKFDVGEIIRQGRMPLPADSTAPEVLERLSHIGASLLLDCLSNLETSLANSQPQPVDGVTLAPKVDSSMSKIDWTLFTATQVYDRWRALQHLFKLHTTWQGQNICLDVLQPPVNELPSNRRSVTETAESFNRGHVTYLKRQKCLYVRCRENWVPCSRITVEKKPTMSALDFANGYLSKVSPEKHYFGT